MRTRFAVLATVLSALVVSAAPAVANAAPYSSPSLTINATPNPDHRWPGRCDLRSADGSAEQRQQADRAVPPDRSDGPTSRSSASAERTRWASTRSRGLRDRRLQPLLVRRRHRAVAGTVQSPTIDEKVSALVTLTADGNTTTTVNTAQPVRFFGHVAPYHPFEPVLLQEQNSLTGNGWTTIARTTTFGGSNFRFSHRWTVPGTYTLRAVFPGDPRNIAGDSQPVTVTVQQKQVPSFTINSSNPIIQDGGSTTIAGVLYAKGSTATPEPTTEVTLYEAIAGGSWQSVATTTTGTDGSYSFTESPAHNTAYQVRTTLPPTRHSAILFEGVSDVVTLVPTSTTGLDGGTDMLTTHGQPRPHRSSDLPAAAECQRQLAGRQRRHAANRFDVHVHVYVQPALRECRTPRADLRRPGEHRRRLDAGHAHSHRRRAGLEPADRPVATGQDLVSWARDPWARTSRSEHRPPPASKRRGPVPSLGMDAPHTIGVVGAGHDGCRDRAAGMRVGRADAAARPRRRGARDAPCGRSPAA